MTTTIFTSSAISNDSAPSTLTRSLRQPLVPSRRSMGSQFVNGYWSDHAEVWA